VHSRRETELRPAPTLWTTVAPSETPSGVLDRIDVMTEEQLAAEAERALASSQEVLDQLLQPYRTAISEETLSQILD
jgi:hypothetical protein